MWCGMVNLCKKKRKTKENRLIRSKRFLKRLKNTADDDVICLFFLRWKPLTKIRNFIEKIICLCIDPYELSTVMHSKLSEAVMGLELSLMKDILCLLNFFKRQLTLLPTLRSWEQIVYAMECLLSFNKTLHHHRRHK